jgi:hypothetical protein
MDNLDQRRDFSASEQNVKSSSVRSDREKDQRDKKRIRRKARRERKRQARSNETSVQHNMRKSQNFQLQIPPLYHRSSPERYERNQYSKQIDNRSNTTRYNYDARTRNDGYTTRLQNHTQSTRTPSLRRDRYIRNRYFDKRRSRPHYSNYNKSNTRVCDSSRRYNKSPSPIRHRILSESSGSTSSIKERYTSSIKERYTSSIKEQSTSSIKERSTSSIKEPIIRINTQFASSSYLVKADETHSLKDPLPKLLVLDLNGTLVYRDNAKRDIILRPHMERFMKYIFDSSNNFAVMVWSSAQPKNVDKMVRAAFGSYEKKLVAKWTRKHLNLSDQDYYQKVDTIKDLEKVWRELNNNKPTTFPQIVWDQTNTILIDDSYLKAKLQPYNAIHLPDFDDERCKSRKDHELYNVIDYLRILHNQSNVSAYIKNFPYTSPNDSKI